MPVRWYVCPYDTVPHPFSGVGRRCSMCRYVPRIPNAAGAVWEETEVLGNHALVRVRAPLVALSAIDADADFVEIPHGTSPIPVVRRAAIRSRLVALGYTDPEILTTGWDVRPLLALVASVCGQVVRRPDLTGFDASPGVRRLPWRRLEELEARVVTEA